MQARLLPACKGYNEPYYAHAIGDWGARRELGGGSFVQAGRAQEGSPCSRTLALLL